MIIRLRYRLILCILLSVAILSGCSPMKVEQFSGQAPALVLVLVLEEYFNGRVSAWGIFEDRFGRLRRQFRVDIQGEWDGHQLVLNEQFSYSDGETESRVWTIKPLGNGRYSGTADDIVGKATGVSAGNALNWRYQMDLKVGNGRWRVSFNDWMFLQPGGVMVNRARVSKWGLKLGEVTLFFIREAPSNDEADKRPFS